MQQYSIALGSQSTFYRTDSTLLVLQNVQPEKLFSRERAVEQLLGIIDSVSMKDNGRYIAWDGQDIPW